MNLPLIGKYAWWIWQFVGPVVYVLLGAYVANWSQRRRWIAENKKDEYRGLLKSLSEAFLGITHIDTGEGLDVNREASLFRFQAENAFLLCVFVDPRLTTPTAYEKWNTAIEAYMETLDFGTFLDQFKVVRNEIASAARNVTP